MTVLFLNTPCFGSLLAAAAILIDKAFSAMLLLRKEYGGFLFKLHIYLHIWIQSYVWNRKSRAPGKG
jgi:hypothetical protein